MSNARNIFKNHLVFAQTSKSDIDFLKVANTIETCSNLAIIVTIFLKLENVIDICSNFLNVLHTHPSFRSVLDICSNFTNVI